MGYFKLIKETKLKSYPLPRKFQKSTLDVTKHGIVIF
jgi:hypothetical protein